MVAFAIANTLTMNVLEQTRDLALLRVVAMTRHQVRKTILAQAVLIGAIAIALGLVVGMFGSYTTNLCSYAELGHTVPFAMRPGLLAATFVVALSLVVIVAWLPAARASKLNLLIALRGRLRERGYFAGEEEPVPRPEACNLISPKKRFVVIGDDAVPFIRDQGMSVLRPGMLSIDENVRAGDEVFIMAPDGTCIGVGRAKVDAAAARAMEKGSIVRTRRNIVSQIVPGRAGWDDAVRANTRVLTDAEAEADADGGLAVLGSDSPAGDAT